MPLLLGEEVVLLLLVVDNKLDEDLFNNLDFDVVVVVRVVFVIVVEVVLPIEEDLALKGVVARDVPPPPVVVSVFLLVDGVLFRVVILVLLDGEELNMINHFFELLLPATTFNYNLTF